MSNEATPKPTARPATHILGLSGTMMGVTATIIGLVKLLETQTGNTSIDELAGFLVIIFLFSAVTSYASVRTEARISLSRQLERAADLAFLVGLISLGLLALVFTWKLV